jgi:hypothetical protein
MGKEGIESSVGAVGAASCLYWTLLPNNHLPQKKEKKEKEIYIEELE